MRLRGRKKARTGAPISHLCNHSCVQKLPPIDSRLIPSSHLVLQTRKLRLGPSASTEGGEGGGSGKELGPQSSGCRASTLANTR